jgi:rubrerythrin
MNKILQKYIDTAIRAEELAVNFYSKFSRRFQKDSPLQLLLESAAKQKVLDRIYFNSLAVKARLGHYNIKESKVDFSIALDLNHFFQDIEIVGDHSALKSLFTRAKGFQDALVAYYESISHIFQHEPELMRIIDYNKSLSEEIQNLMTKEEIVPE